MRRFLSWIVLCAVSLLVEIVLSMAVRLGWYVVGLIGKLGTLLQIIVILFAGTSILSFFVFPVSYGMILALKASEAVCPTRKGTRYVLLGVSMLVIDLLCFFIDIVFRRMLSLNYLVACIYYIMIIFTGREYAKDY